MKEKASPSLSFRETLERFEDCVLLGRNFVKVAAQSEGSGDEENDAEDGIPASFMPTADDSSEVHGSVV